MTQADNEQKYLAWIIDLNSGPKLARFAEDYLCVPIAKFAKIDVVEDKSDVYLEGAALQRVKVRHPPGFGRLVTCYIFLSSVNSQDPFIPAVLSTSL